MSVVIWLILVILKYYILKCIHVDKKIEYNYLQKRQTSHFIQKKEKEIISKRKKILNIINYIC